MAFGGHVHHCFAYVFTTTASGKGAEEIVTERLAAMASQSLAKLKFRRELDPDLREAPKLDAPRMEVPPPPN